MAIVVDAARDLNSDKRAHNTTYQKGNADNNPPTWLETIELFVGTVETHIPPKYGTPTANDTDSWLPIIETQFIT